MAIAKKRSNRKRAESVLNIDQFYTAEFIGALAREFKILEKNQIELLKECLINAAGLYCATEQIPTVRQELVRHRETFERLSQTIVTLEDQLNALADEQRFRLWDSVWDDPSVLQRMFPKASIRGFHEPGRYESEGSLRDLLSSFQKLLADRIGRLQKADKGGRPRNRALLIWAVVIRHFWEGVLKRTFSRADKRGNAYSFCRRAITPLVPDINESELRTAMRLAIEQLPVTIRYEGKLAQVRNAKKSRLQKPRKK
jgi:hypothetical protein